MGIAPPHRLDGVGGVSVAKASKRPSVKTFYVDKMVQSCHSAPIRPVLVPGAVDLAGMIGLTAPIGNIASDNTYYDIV